VCAPVGGTVWCKAALLPRVNSAARARTAAAAPRGPTARKTKGLVMTEVAAPIKTQVAILIMTKTKATGVLVLYPDRLVYVKSQVIRVCACLGFAVIAVLSFVLAHAGPGALGGIVGAGGGQAIGNAIARRQAPRKVAAGGSDVVTIALDSVASVEERKAGRLKGWRLVVSTSQQLQYTFRVKPGHWPSDLANALTALGQGVQTTPAGLAVLSQSGS
jgi:hypothetical protein